MPTYFFILLGAGIVTTCILTLIIMHLRNQLNHPPLQQKRMEIALRSSEEQYKDIIELSPYGIVIHSNDKILFANNALVKMLHASSEAELINQSLLGFIHPDDRLLVSNRFKIIYEENAVIKAIEEKLIRNDGSTVQVEATSASAMYEGIPSIQTFFRDISERKSIARRIEELAFHDSLTGLPNRNFLEKNVNTFIQNPHSKSTLAILLLDINRFRNINDTYGHAIGDQILKIIAERLQKNFPAPYFVARIIGEDFVVTAPNVKDLTSLEAIAKNIVRIIAEPILISNREFYISASVGISTFPDNSRTYEELLRFANIAVFYAKQEKNDNYHFFQEKMLIPIKKQSELEAALHQALEKNEFILYYQPFLSLKDESCAGAEVLLRWNFGGDTLLTPEEFINVTIESGLIVPLTDWILRSACQQLKVWLDSSLPVPRITVNITAHYLASANLINNIKAILKDTGLSGDRLELEITENVLIYDIESTREKLLALQQLGIKIAIDDFGTGYSSFNYLKSFSFDHIKIDQSFIHDMESSSSDLAIVKAIIATGKSFNAKLIAEGVESAREQRLLALLGCDEIQGYQYCRPNTAEIITQFLQNHA